MMEPQNENPPPIEKRECRICGYPLSESNKKDICYECLLKESMMFDHA